MSKLRKGQVSFEFLMVTGVALFILAASTMFMFSYTQTSEEKSALAQAAQIGYKIVDQAYNVYTFGKGSFVTVTANVPEHISAVYVVDNNTLVFDIDTIRGTISLPIFSVVDINGTARIGEQVHVNSSGKVIHAGRTTYRIESKGDWVQIQQTS